MVDLSHHDLITLEQFVAFLAWSTQEGWRLKFTVLPYANKVFEAGRPLLATC